ncbi:hypothetical protein D3C73_1458790 [compost metagenome]
MLHMHPDLVGPARLKLELHQRGVLCLLQRLVPGYGGIAARCYPPPLGIVPVLADGTVDHSG